MPDVPERCPFCNSGYRREEAWRGRPAYSFSCGTVCYANGEVAFRYFACYAREKKREERAIREQFSADRAEAERLMTENERLHRRIERLEAKLARQRAVISRLQAAVERRNSDERIEALRRAVYDETVERYMREYDAAADEAERWRKKYEALRASVERAVQDLRKWAYSAARDWQQSGHHPYHDGASDAYYEAEQLVRLVLAEEG